MYPNSRVTPGVFAQMVDAVDTQRVNAAVHLAARRAVNEMTTIDNRQALEFSIGRRLQGTYGAQLRALAAQDPELSVAELAEQVIFPAEYPDDIPEAGVYSGDRDRARRTRPNAQSPDDGWREGRVCEQLTGWRDGIVAAKASLTEPSPRALEPQREPDPAYAGQFITLREALTVGVQLGGQARKSRLTNPKGTP